MSTVPPTGSAQDGATVRRATPAFLEVGHILAGRYEIRRPLGRGAMGEVWLALDLKLRVEVALKDLSFRRDDREMVRREVRTARDVVSPNVCRVFDLVEVETRELLSMEYIDGVTLRQLIEERSPLDLSEAQTIASQLLAGLESIHGAGLVHRDLKPENVMITRTGRVVIMDFGLARSSTSDSASIAGTPAYMSPEQARGDPMDPRTDIFAVGVLLAELVTNARTRETRASIWEGIRKRPAEIPSGPWVAVLQKAVSRDRSERYKSAREMARALEQVTLRVATAEDRYPYPGLAAFTEKESEFFFGREAEVEAMLRKLERFHLLALIGPSGAGKSSFLRAGLLTALPKSWDVLFMHPGSSPLVNMGETLALRLAGEAVPELVRFSEPGAAVALVRRWRGLREESLVVIDQFEELFTLNGGEVQNSFADLIGRLVIEADVHVLLCLRDDFLIHCHKFDALAPVLSDLSALTAPAGAALRRALVQPALRCGYRFEDDALVESMLADVGEERGTLPLLAFAASQLWEKRDRDAGLLTKHAYEEIGGVSGALAKHADAVLESIGTDRTNAAREIFRNLVTARGTRATRRRDELLSLFPDGKAVNAVIDALIDARLLTSYEDGRVEIIHESLLVAWPRLVQWRAQDEEGTILRDQLRQAAQVWQERGRPDELLWTGRAYREFLLWKERYPGSLAAVEQTFASAMVTYAERRKRRLRASLAAAAVLAVTVLTVMTALWRRSVNESRRAEAQQLLALAQLEIDRYPTAALAYATRSLEVVDSPVVRRLVMEILWRGPIARFLQLTPGGFPTVKFTPDGKSLVMLSDVGRDFVIAEDGKNPRALDIADSQLARPLFTDDGRFLVVFDRISGSLRVLSFPDGRLVRTIPKGRDSFAKIIGSKIVTSSPTGDQIVRWDLDRGEATQLGAFDDGGSKVGDLHPSGAWTAVLHADGVYQYPVGHSSSPPRMIWRPHRPPSDVNFEPTGEFLIANSKAGLELWWPASHKSRWLPIPEDSGREMADPPVVIQSKIAAVTWGAGSRRVWLWDLENPPDAEPLTLRSWGSGPPMDVSIHPRGSWVAACAKDGSVSFSPLHQPYVRTIRMPAFDYAMLQFSPDSSQLAVCGNPPVAAKLWAVDPTKESRTLVPPNGNCTALGFDPTGTKVLAGSHMQGFFLHSFPDHRSRQVIKTPISNPTVAMFDRSGEVAVMAAGNPDPTKRQLHVMNIRSGTIETFASNGFNTAAFGSDGHLYSGGVGGVHRWNVKTGRRELVHGRQNERGRVAGSGDGRFILEAFGEGDPWFIRGDLLLLDLNTQSERRINTHGSEFNDIAINRTGLIIATADSHGAVRIGRASGEEPHLLLGHKSGVNSLAFSPDGKWLASVSEDEIRLWPIPDLSRPPLHTLPHDKLVSKLHELTNLRAVPDQRSSNGYKLEVGSFPGWKETPIW